VRWAFEVHSGYRHRELNRCAGGAARSAHLLAFAIDITTQTPPDARQRLCDFWLAHGRSWNMGLGHYPSGRMHIDTHGYRSWGADGSAQSAVCRASPP
jgi:uncharacterized protein YcbK (DUF882 family)